MSVLRKKVERRLKIKKGILYKYAKQVSSASKGCVTDMQYTNYHELKKKVSH